MPDFTPPKTLYTAEELVLLAGTSKVDFLWDNFLPRAGVAVLVGQPDTGKSQFAKQLSAFVANRQTNFLGFELSPDHGRAIYVSTEDGEQPTGSGIALQNKQLGFTSNHNFLVRFLLDENLDQLLADLERIFKTMPCDLVTIDAFGDIFEGADSNSNVAMRKVVQKFNFFAQKHNCCVLLVHHLNKAGYGASPSQKHVQGGSGLAQKVRSVMQLSNSNGNSRKFSVTKGNYTPKQYKENWLELDFDDESLVFTTEGVWSSIATSAPMTQTKKQRDFTEFLAAFPSKGLSFNDLAKSIMGFYEVSSATASRVIKDLHLKGLVKLTGRIYQLSSLSSGGEEDDSDSFDSSDTYDIDDSNDCDNGFDYDHDDEPEHVSDDDVFD